MDNIIDHNDVKTIDTYKKLLDFQYALRLIAFLYNISVPFKKILASISPDDTKITNDHFSVSDGFQLFLEGVDFYRFAKKNDDIKQILSENEIKLLQYSNILTEFDWTPFRNDNMSHIDNIISIWKEQKTKEQKQIEIGEEMLRYFSESRINDLYTKWCSKLFLKRRIGILKDALSAHTNGQYNLSIPIFLSQLEGMVADIFSHKGELHEPAYKKYIQELVRVQDFGTYNTLFENLFVTTIMASFQHGKTINSYLSRHAILHGASVSYGTAENSLKVILLYDLIQGCAKYCCYNNNRTFHLVGCEKIRKIEREEIKETEIQKYNPRDYYIIQNKNVCKYFKRKLLFYDSYEEALESKVPCKCCIKHGIV